MKIPKASALTVDTHADSRPSDTNPLDRRDQAEAAPRFGLFLFGCVEAAALRETLGRIPEELDDCFEEVVVMLDRPSRRAPFESDALLRGRRLRLRFHRPPHDSGYGAARKDAFEYALLKGFDQVIVMCGDASHPPEALPQLVQQALRHPSRFVLARRPDEARPFLAYRLSHRLSTFVQNRILGMRLSDYQTSFRVYPTEALRRIPFQLNSLGEQFDFEVLLQLRALGIPIHEELLPRGLGAERSRDGGFVTDAAGCASAIGYRLHQMHVTRDGRYLVDHEIHYTLKHSDTGSHVQIVSAIAPRSRVLDLGCSSGLLARPLREKDVQVTGVDAGPGDLLAKELAEYYQRDLELPLELPFGRVFGYVVCADVIEHLRNRGQLLRGARRYLKPDGRLIISTPNIALWFYRLSLLVGRFEYGPRGVLDETHVHLYTGSTFRREVENAGFDVLRQRVTALPFEVVFESTGRSRFVRGLAIAYHWLARLWPSMFAYQYVLEARITTLDEEAIVESSSGAGEPARGRDEAGSFD